MTDSKIHRLIARIAEETHDAIEAEAVVEMLSKVQDWSELTKLGKARRQGRERNRVYSENKRARKISLEGNLSSKEWFETLNYFNWKCAYCQKDFSYEIMEHFIPLKKKKEGTTIWNCVPACIECNKIKRVIDIDDWFEHPRLDLDIEDWFGDSLKRIHQYLQERRNKAKTILEEAKQHTQLEYRTKYRTK